MQFFEATFTGFMTKEKLIKNPFWKTNIIVEFFIKNLNK